MISISDSPSILPGRAGGGGGGIPQQEPEGSMGTGQGNKAAQGQEDSFHTNRAVLAQYLRSSIISEFRVETQANKFSSLGSGPGKKKVLTA